MASRKNKFAVQCQSVDTTIARAIEDARALEETWSTRTYNAGGNDELVDADVAGLEITAAQVTAFIVLAGELAKLVDNEAVTQAYYSITLNAIRTDI